ncbi:MAG TPA: tetratricopeptide repeat protein, partial [Verrucomicrobiae bacterium]|nr:tetratricopeptide repeat protein [Verrucomicrobiae bacterium]
RPDVDLILQGVGSADLPPLKFDPDTDPVFLTHHPNWSLKGLELVPVGLTFRAWREGRPDPPLLLPAERLDGEDDALVPREYLTQNLIGQFHYMLGITFEERDWLRARGEFRRATEASPDNDVLFFNLGLIYRRNGLLDESRAAFERCRAINPRHLASASRPTAEAKIAEVAQEEKRVAAIETEIGAQAAAASGGAEAGSVPWHLAMAELLDQRGETAAARGHRLRALAGEGSVGEQPPQGWRPPR